MNLFALAFFATVVVVCSWRFRVASFIFYRIKNIMLHRSKKRSFFDQNTISPIRLSEFLNIDNFCKSTTEFKKIVVSVVKFTLPDIDLIVECQLPDQFPVFPPRVIITPSQGSQFELPITWNHLTIEPPEYQLGKILKDALFREITVLQTVNNQEAVSYGPANSGIAATSDQDLAIQQGWPAIYSQNRVPLDISEKYFARSGGVLSQKLSEKCVSIFGCGSGGSYLAEQLARSGLGKIVLFDMEEVEAENLCRSGYEIADLGVSKVNALARKLRNINPAIHLEIHHENLLNLSHDQLRDTIESSHAVIAGTDMPEAQKRLNEYAYKLEIPAVFPGLYQKALGGEVVMTIPGKTPCYQCSLGHRWEFIRIYLPETETGETIENRMKIEPSMDYSTGSLKAEPGLAGDIQHLDSITLKLLFGLLLQDISDDQPCETRDFLRGLSPKVNEGNFATKNFVITCHSPNFWFFPQVRDDPSQDYAYHSTWVETSEYRKLDCPICGDMPELLKSSLSINDIIQGKAI
jgi:hypothetical protein